MIPYFLFFFIHRSSSPEEIYTHLQTPPANKKKKESGRPFSF